MSGPDKDAGGELLGQGLPNGEQIVLVGRVRQAHGGHQQAEGMVCGQASGGFGQAGGFADVETAHIDNGVKRAEVPYLCVGNGGEACPLLQCLGLLPGSAVAAAIENDAIHRITSFGMLS